jgi:MurE/MurF fusion protein
MLIGKFFKKVKKECKSHFFSGLSFDSSRCKKNNIFFAIKGNEMNGNNFVDHAITKGAKTIVSNQRFEGIKKNILYIKSKNVRKSLSSTAYAICSNKPKNLIAVTGTNGKSSIADFYYQILRLNKKKVASIGTLGIHTALYKKNVLNTTLDPIELSITLEKIKKKGIDNVILEASSHGLKQHRLDGLGFKIGIFTNLSHDHLDYHKNFDNYLKAKLYLFEKLLKKKGTIITDIEIPEYKKIKSIAKKKEFNIKTISNKNSNLNIISHRYFKDKQLVEIKYKNKIYKFQTGLIGKIQIKNILMSMIAAEKSGLKFKKIISTINKVKPVNGRLEQIGIIKNNSTVILDYAHTPVALRTCLENIKEQFKDKKISIVFGCGGNRDQSKRSMMGKIVDYYCDRVYLTDDNPRKENPKKIRHEIKKNINKSKFSEIPDRSKAIKKAIFDLKIGDVLIIAGKGHENIQDYGKDKRFFSDRKEILDNIKIKNYYSFKDIKLNILKELSRSNNIPLKTKINKASINSKEIKKNDIFFAIKGKNLDGNLFTKEAFEKKASLAVTNKSIKNNRHIKVKDTLKFLTDASSLLRKNSSSKIIAITGSCGKTSLKELLGRTFNKISKVTYSPKSFNNKYGVPLSLFNLKKNDDFGIFEVGMDKKGEIDSLSKIIKPDVGVITNISYAHIKNFKNIHQIANAKSEIIRNINRGGYLILNYDDQFFHYHKKIAIKNDLKILTFSLNNKLASIYLKRIVKERSKYKIYVNVDNKDIFFYINSIFENDIKNILASIIILSIFKDIQKLNKNIFYDHKVPKGRGDIKKVKLGKKTFYIVDESYNSNPLSLISALKNFNELNIDTSRKKLLLGDMLELGKYSKKLHLEIGSSINKTSLKNINVIGKHIMWTYNNLDKSRKGIVIKDKSQIIDLIKNNLNNNDYLMIKGSNFTGLNSLVNNLKKGIISAL